MIYFGTEFVVQGTSSEAKSISIIYNANICNFIIENDYHWKSKSMYRDIININNNYYYLFAYI